MKNSPLWARNRQRNVLEMCSLSLSALDSQWSHPRRQYGLEHLLLHRGFLYRMDIHHLCPLRVHRVLLVLHRQRHSHCLVQVMLLQHNPLQPKEIKRMLFDHRRTRSTAIWKVNCSWTKSGPHQRVSWILFPSQLAGRTVDSMMSSRLLRISKTTLPLERLMELARSERQSTLNI